MHQPQNPPNQKTQIPPHLMVQIEIKFKSEKHRTDSTKHLCFAAQIPLHLMVQIEIKFKSGKHRTDSTEHMCFAAQIPLNMINSDSSVSHGTNSNRKFGPIRICSEESQFFDLLGISEVQHFRRKLS